MMAITLFKTIIWWFSISDTISPRRKGKRIFRPKKIKIKAITRIDLMKRCNKLTE
jgi:hypothetical protein